MRRLLLSLATLQPILHATAQDGLWSPVSKDYLKTYLNGRSAVSQLPASYELVKLNRSQFELLQKQAPLVKPGMRSTLSPVRVSLPLPIADHVMSGISVILEQPLLCRLGNFLVHGVSTTVQQYVPSLDDGSTERPDELPACVRIGNISKRAAHEDPHLFSSVAANPEM